VTHSHRSEWQPPVSTLAGLSKKRFMKTCMVVCKIPEEHMDKDECYPVGTM
jgi:hypothetical protein